MANDHGPSIKDDPYQRAQELDDDGRSDLTKDELIHALRTR